jgi:hypothetical protein
MKRMIFIFNVLLMNSLVAFGQTDVKDAYEFPIKPGTEEWKQLEPATIRIAALQIPDAVLASISTEGLLETCLHFPYLSDIVFYRAGRR